MLDVLLLILVLWMIWRNGCCIKKRISGVLCPHCAKCDCKECPSCGKKRTCEKCPDVKPSKECECSPCKKYKCDLKEAFDEADEARYTEGIDETVKVVNVAPGPDKKPKVVIKKQTIAKTLPGSVVEQIKPTVVVKVPPPPKCNCPSCSNQLYGSYSHTYYPIYQPLPYGVRY
jgi:hypothetical protein